MAALPAKTEFNGALVSEAAYKIAFEQMHDYLTGLLGNDGVPATARGALGALQAFPAGTRLLFQQTSAPVGWTKETGASYNDAALRFVTGVAATGGADAFSTHFGTGKSTNGHALTTPQLPVHGHPVVDTGHAHSERRADGSNGNFGLNNATGGGDQCGIQNGSFSTGSATTGISVGNTGGGEMHSHVLANFNIKYADTIIATKD